MVYCGKHKSEVSDIESGKKVWCGIKIPWGCKCYFYVFKIFSNEIYEQLLHFPSFQGTKVEIHN